MRERIYIQLGRHSDFCVIIPKLGLGPTRIEMLK